MTDLAMEHRRPDLWARLYCAANYAIALLLSLMQVGPPARSVLQSSNTLDPSWMVDAYLAAAGHAKFGSSYVWSYGPLGFADFVLPISRHLMNAAELIEIALAILLPVLLLHILASRLRLPAASVTLAILVLLLPPHFGTGGIEQAALISALMLLYAASDGSGLGDSAAGRTAIGSAVAIAFAGALLAVGPLVKASLLPPVLGTIVMWSLSACLRRRWDALGLLIIPFLGVWFGVFAALGGGIADGISWPMAEVPIIAGYAPAMAVHGPIVYLALAAILAALALVSGAVALRSRPDRWWFIGAVALLWIDGFKESFVRQDMGHVLGGIFSTAPWCALLLWWASRSGEPRRAGRGREPSRWHRRGATASAVAACGLCFAVFGLQTPIAVPSLADAIARLQELTAGAGLAASAHGAGAALAAQEVAGVAERPGLAPLVPLLRGRRAFAWPWDGNAVVSAGGREEFPPIPQEYSAYTTALDRMDAAFFSSPARPPLGLVSVEAIDGRLPLQTAGLSFVNLLACYRPAVLSGSFLLVEQRAPASAPCSPPSPASSPSTPWTRARLAEWLPVPSSPGEITLIQIRIEMSPFGALMKWLLRPTPLNLNMRLADGTTELFRLVHATLSEGVLVSTVLASTAGLARLWLGTADNSVAVVALATGRPGQWAPSFRFRFVRIPIAPAYGAGESLSGAGAPHGAAKGLRVLGVMPAPAALQSLFARDSSANWAWIVLSTMYADRVDWQRAFPESAPEFPRTLLEWILTAGVTMDSEAAMLRPYRQAFRAMQNRLVSPATR